MQKRSKLTRTLLASAIVLASTLTSGRLLPLVKAAESNGTLDTSFGVGGKVITNFAGLDDQSNAVAVQPDGKIVAAGQADRLMMFGLDSDFGLARYNSDGTLDDSFGTNGIVTTNILTPTSIYYSFTDQALAVAVQPNGKIVAAGRVQGYAGLNDFALVRYNSDGTLDDSFGTGGIVTTEITRNTDVAFSVAIQPNGKIIAAGVSIDRNSFDFALIRYNNDGTLDDSFGSGGIVTTDFAGSNDQAFSAALQPNGKIVLAGLSDSGGAGFDFALARYNSDGTLDDSFGTGGKVTTDFVGLTDQARSVAVWPNGKIVAAGQTRSSVSSVGIDFGLVRYNNDGTLDADFGTNGKVTTDFEGFIDSALSVAIQPNGKIVAAGSARTNASTASSNFALARYNGDGTLDDSFGIGGKVNADFAGNTDVARSVVVRPNGKIFVAGSASVGGGLDFALARFD